jgi:hypothetical protein
MLALSGVFLNIRILDTMNYTNQDYVHINYTLIVIQLNAISNQQPIKKRLMFCLDMAQLRSLIGQS